MQQTSILAQADPRGRVYHECGQCIHVEWHGDHFQFSRADFHNWVDALRRGSHDSFAECDAYSVVWADESTAEVWIHDQCLTLPHTEFKALYEVALKAETRLHGVRCTQPAPPEPIPVKVVATVRPPRPLRFAWN